jgi:sulfite reductase (NADPH) flavoprotein alpha-component
MIMVKSDPRASVGVNLGRYNTVFVNPYNGEIVGSQSPTHNFLRDIVDWHRWLGVEGEGRATARAITGACNLAFFLVGTGEAFGFAGQTVLSKLTEGKISMPETSFASVEPIDAPLAQTLSEPQLDLPHSAIRLHENVVRDAAPVEWSSASFNDDVVLILYGTVTGNAEMLANKVAAMVRRTGRTARVHDMAHCQANMLNEASCVLVITSTHGDGEPPEDAAPFWQAVVHGNGLELRGVKFSVLALGNTPFDHFCKCGRDLDAALERHGATHLYPRVDCDVDYKVPATDWIHGVLACLELETRAATSA